MIFSTSRFLILLSQRDDLRLARHVEITVTQIVLDQTGHANRVKCLRPLIQGSFDPRHRS